MSELFLETADVRKLARAYIALALAQDIAKRDLKDFAEATQPLVHILDMSSQLLEDVLQYALPEKEPLPLPSLTCSDMLM
jgi:hypothetical protein